MIHYFVDGDGERIYEEDAPRGYFYGTRSTFYKESTAKKEGIKQMKKRIRELQECILQFENDIKGENK